MRRNRRDLLRKSGTVATAGGLGVLGLSGSAAASCDDHISAQDGEPHAIVESYDVSTDCLSGEFVEMEIEIEFTDNMESMQSNLLATAVGSVFGLINVGLGAFTGYAAGRLSDNSDSSATIVIQEYEDGIPYLVTNDRTRVGVKEDAWLIGESTYWIYSVDGHTLS